VDLDHQSGWHSSTRSDAIKAHRDSDSLAEQVDMRAVGEAASDEAIRLAR
jgi:hypothetical protein